MSRRDSGILAIGGSWISILVPTSDGGSFVLLRSRRKGKRILAHERLEDRRVLAAVTYLPPTTEIPATAVSRQPAADFEFSQSPNVSLRVAHSVDVLRSDVADEMRVAATFKRRGASETAAMRATDAAISDAAISGAANPGTSVPGPADPDLPSLPKPRGSRIGRLRLERITRPAAVEVSPNRRNCARRIGLQHHGANQ